MLDKVSIIYNTCDKYESLWHGFFTLFNKYWPNCTSDIILNTETKSFNFKGLKIKRPSAYEENCSWSQRLINSLNTIETPYVIMILDDFYFKSPVDLEKVAYCVQRMEKDPKIELFTFGWQPGPNKIDKEDSNFELRGRFAKYRVNAQIGLWRVSYLKRILKTYENPWQFELSGSFRSSLMGGKLYALKKNAPLVFNYDWGFLIVRGKINRKIADYFAEKEKLNMNLPFEDFDENEYISPKGVRGLRMVKYFAEMMISLFRK